MNILFYLTRYPGIGGIENVTNLVASRLLEDNQVAILSHVQQDGVKPIEGVSLYKMPNGKVWTAPENFEYADRLVVEKHFDAIIYQDSYAHTERIVCEIAEKYRIPLYVFEHNSPLFVYNKRSLDPITSIKGLMRRVLHPYILHLEIKRKKYLLSHATKYILLSKKFVPEFCRLVGGVDVKDSRIGYINNPIVGTECNKTIEKENIILCVSRLAPEKCVRKMLVMWKALSEQLQNWRFIIVGDGPDRKNLEGYAQKHKLSRIEFVGFANPTEYYQKSKVFWMTSKFEGWGMTLVEAMQQGCVPIAYHTFSSITDIIDDGKDGFLVKPFDEATFMDMTKKLAEDNSLWDEMSDEAIEKVKAFSIERILRDWKIMLS